MPLSINTNIASLTAQRAMMNSNAGLERSFERLSTGQRINSASDDAAGLAIGKDLESRVSGLNQAIRNANDGISMVQIAEGALDEATTILQRMRDLSVQAANGSLSATEQKYLDDEQEKLATTLDSVLSQAAFNDIGLLGSADKAVTFQIGADRDDTLGVTFDKINASELKVDKTSIALNGTGSKEKVTFASFALGSGAAQVSYGPVTVSGTYAAGDTITFELDGTSYTADANGAVGDLDALILRINAATTGGGTALSTIGTATKETVSGSDHLVFTYSDATAVVGAGTNSLTVTDAAVAASPPAIAGVSAAVTQADLRSTDKFQITVGSGASQVVVETAAARYGTVAEVATALDTAAQANADAKFGVSEVGGAIVIEYSINGNQTPVTGDYTLTKSNGVLGTGGANGAANPNIVEGQNDASSAIVDIDAALAEVAKDRAALGGTQQQLEATVRNLANVAENTAAAESRIMDTDYAAETANLTKAQILQQAATSILAQANAQPQAVLSLLQ
jgi:flagellin